ncbi:hypothetical protein BS78_07G174400 [Paspalum vaginatum]|nr:hypothetical protein BS78_07G174400 [Paspalum vaginatum]
MTPFFSQTPLCLISSSLCSCSSPPPPASPRGWETCNHKRWTEQLGGELHEQLRHGVPRPVRRKLYL